LARVLTLATFNVKDLFESGAGAANSAPARKLDEIATQLRRADADVFALQEIASREALLHVVSRLPNGADYRHVLLALPDQRGIRNAIVSRLPFVMETVHMADELPFPIFREGDAPPFPKRIPLRRGVPHVRVDVPQVGLVDVLTVHFKSKLPFDMVLPDGSKKVPMSEMERAEGDVRSLVLRAAEALHVRGLVDAALAVTPNVALMGDLNDTLDSLPLQIVRGRAEGALHPCADIIPKEARFSILHDGRKQQIDHILVSALLRERLEGAAFQNESLRDHGPFVPGVAPTADSDHALFVARFHANRLSRDSFVNTQRSP
jgi:endonuclease/exonuclease/phosphatase family metal-dependent hydrolase